MVLVHSIPLNFTNRERDALSVAYNKNRKYLLGYGIMQLTSPPLSTGQILPTMYDLPSEDPEEPGLPDEFHLLQPELLRQTFQPPAYAADNFFTASDLNLYYDPSHPQWYKRPDWFGVLGVSRLYDQRDLRLSYVIWQEEIICCVSRRLKGLAQQFGLK